MLEDKLKNFLDIFGKIKYISSLCETISKEESVKKRKIANDILLDLIPLDYLNSFYLEQIIRTTNKLVIKFQDKLDIERLSGYPNATHPISVEYLLAKVEAPWYVLAAGAKHDDVEEYIDKKITDKNTLNLKNEVNIALCTECSKLSDIISESKIKTEKLFPEFTIPEIDNKDIIKSCIILGKVTRYEKEENYYQSIDRIFDINIDESNFCYKIKSEIYEIIEKEKISFDEHKKIELCLHAGNIKLADRTANTHEKYEEQKDTNLLKQVYKNIYVMNQYNLFIKNYDMTGHDKTIKASKTLKNVLLDVSKNTLEKMLESIKLDRDLKDKIDDELDDYIKQGGFKSTDYGFDNNIFSGNIRRFFNKFITKKDKELAVMEIENSNSNKYIAINGLLKLLDSYSNNDQFTMSGLDMLGKENKLGFWDNMGKKCSILWKFKKDYRKIAGVKSNESFYEKK